MATDLKAVADDKGIRYFLISFTDLFGVVRSKLVPAQAISDMQANGAGFAGFAAHLDMTPADADMFAIPDPDSLAQLPWKSEVGWFGLGLGDQRDRRPGAVPVGDLAPIALGEFQGEVGDGGDGAHRRVRRRVPRAHIDDAAGVLAGLDQELGGSPLADRAAPALRRPCRRHRRRPFGL